MATTPAIAAPAAPTPGPWRWEFNAKTKTVQLVGGNPRFDLTVMDFVRWGMSRAAPRFLAANEPRLMVLERAEAWAKPVPGREHHFSWFQRIVHPDATLIQSAPVMLAALLRLRDHPATPIELVPIIVGALDEALGIR